jgi:hypothetical protein
MQGRSEGPVYEFITVGTDGKIRKWASVKEAFDGKWSNEEVFVELIATGTRARVRRP